MKAELIDIIVKLIIHTYKAANRKLCMGTVDDILDNIRYAFTCRDLKGDD